MRVVSNMSGVAVSMSLREATPERDAPSSSPRTVSRLSVQPARPRPRQSRRGQPWSHPMTLQSMSRGPSTLVSQVGVLEPTCYSQAVLYLEWRKAMDLEFNALLQNNTWRLVPLEPGMNVVGWK